MILTIRPCSRLRGTVRVPGDKSISHRAAIFAALAQGTTRIDGFLESEDCLATLTCLRQLGVSIHKTGEGSYEIAGAGSNGLKEPDDILDCGNSGTTMRLLAGVLAGQPFFSVLTGDASLRRRPMDRIIKPLSQMGANITGRSNNTRAPLAIKGAKLQGCSYESPVASAQVKSAILLAGLSARGWTTVREPCLSRDHTERLLQYFGVPVKKEGLMVTVPGGSSLQAKPVKVPGDMSSAAFLLVAACIVPESDILLKGVGINPTRTGILDVLQEMGADIAIQPESSEVEPAATIRVKSSRLRAIEIGGDRIPSLIDELPVLAVAAAFATGRTVIRDAQELRVKESDRIAIMAGELAQQGVMVEERPDGLIIAGGQPIRGGNVKSHGDHRVAMSLAVLGLRASSPLSIEGAEVIATSFPNFVPTLQQLGADVQSTEKRV